MEPVNYPKPHKGRHLFFGLIVLVAGLLLLLQKMQIFALPPWVFSWPMLLIALGLIFMIRSRFSGPGGIIMMIIGGVFLLDYFPGMEIHLREYTLPLIVIGIGLLIVLKVLFHKPETEQERWKRRYRKLRRHYQHHHQFHHAHFREYSSVSNSENLDNRVELTTVCGNIKKKILSKDFKGGEVVSVLGGMQLDLSQADINGTAVLEATQVFGGLRIIVPSNWEIRIERMSSVMGGVEDKRSTSDVTDSNKVLIITGACVLGGIDIKNF